MTEACRLGSSVCRRCRGGTRACALSSFEPVVVVVAVVAVVEVVGSKKQKGPAWLFGHFQVIDFGSP
jgi:hypothetical protein